MNISTMKMRRQAFLILFLTSFSLIMTSCGGGGGGSEAPLTPHLLSAQMYKFVGGEQYIYDIVGQFTNAGTTTTLTGTLTITVTGPTTINSVSNVFVLNKSAQLLLNGGSSQTLTSKIYFTQDPATFILTFIGDDQGASPSDRFSSPTDIYLPGTWATTSSTQLYNYHFTNGDTTQVAFNIVSKEDKTAKVDKRPFQTWKVSEVVNDSRNGTTNNTQWFAPQIGNYVYFSETGANTLSQNFTATYNLKSTSVPLGP